MASRASVSLPSSAGSEASAAPGSGGTTGIFSIGFRIAGWGGAGGAVVTAAGIDGAGGVGGEPRRQR